MTKPINPSCLSGEVSNAEGMPTVRISPRHFKVLQSFYKLLVGTSGSALSLVAPYSFDGTNYYDPDGFIVSKPSSPSTFTWIGTAPANISLAPGGNLKIASGGAANPGFQSQVAHTSSEIITRILQVNGNTTLASEVGCWLWDSTNNLIYTFSQATTTAAPLVVRDWSYNGTGTPTVVTSLQSSILPYANYAHLRLVKSGGAILAQICLDGQTFDTIYTTGAVGTISKGGIFVADAGTNMIASVLHMKVA